MDIKDVLLRNLNIKKLTAASLKEAIARRYDPLPDDEKRRINREIAHHAMKSAEPAKDKNICAHGAKTDTLSGVNVLGINYFGPLDITIQWNTGRGDALGFQGCRADAGGDQVNVSKVFSAFGENIALVALTGRKDGEITGVWERDFLNDRIVHSFIRNNDEDEQAAIYNVIDGDTLPGMFGWWGVLPKETVANINREAMTMLDRMLKRGPGNIWMTLSSGGPIRYDRNLAYYVSLIELVKKEYADRVKLLIDFKFMSGPEETMSVLNIPRRSAQDVIKPNLEEFIQILVASGLSKKGALCENTITEEAVKTYAVKLRNKYNLLGVLVSMGRSGLILAMEDKIIKEKGINIVQACPTAAGDSLKAGFLYALSRGKSFEEAVHTGNLFGASTASMEGTQTVTPEKLIETETLARSQNVVPEIEKPTL